MDTYLQPTTGLTVSGIDHIVLRVKDLPASIRFYADVLGCPVERRRDDLGLIQLRAGGSLIDLVPVDGVIGKRGGPAAGVDAHNVDHVCLRIAGFEPERVRNHLARHGVEVESEGVRYGSSGDGYSMSVTDPDGNGVELRG
ncbi:VOC family protein [Brevundimonas lenta]|uniref:Catechol 2,3-dioxygenase-like lactoylglutathione lyase family enzyme n=1 Tax=Brevundimonas lenta TaxID=424796 RepID=A0A7W6NQV9_9CAUL|nr:VOC family protein [Brevundimonas lenta]MBB4084064.1 catechol 2,3-dioxygenase-like lactoylglutathione lyase family enzyme [Brevundimonas lenta]